MLQKQESDPNLNDKFLHLGDLLSPIMKHLGVYELVASIRLVNTNWQTIADKLIKEKIEVKKAELERKFLAVQDKINGEEISESIKTYIVEAAENQYLPLLWEQPLDSQDESTQEKKFSFNKMLRSYITRCLFYSESERIFLSKNLQNADFSYANNFDLQVLWGLIFSKPNLRGINFRGCLFDNTKFSNMDLSRANFSNTTIKYTSFRGTNLSGTNFSKAKFDCSVLGQSSSITGANFTDVDFGLNYLHNLSLKDVNLTKANLKWVLDLKAENLLEASHLEGIKLPDEFNFDYMNLAELNLSGAIMKNARLNGASACRTNFSGANLSSAEFKKSVLYRTDFSNCDLSGADLSHARELTKANFYEADLTKAKLDYVDFSDTNITATQLLSAASLLEIKIEKSNFTKDELNLIKSKMLNDYQNFFKTNSFDEILNLLVKIESDETHTLKIQRDFSLRDYGLTASYSDVINYGRKRLVELSKNPSFAPPQPNTSNYEKLQQIFKASIYNWHSSSFWVADDNAVVALNSILGQASKDVDYQFSPKKCL
jgi:uncharacterized protein YjbI with pentapeptide repeats